MATILDTNEMMFTAIEPKMQFRFQLHIEGLPTFLLTSAARPQIEDTVIEIHYINKRYKVKGKTNDSGSFTTTMLDPIAPSGAQAIMQWHHLLHEETTGRDGYTDMFKKDAKLIVLGPVGDIVEEWTYKGLWPSSVNFNTVGWNNDEMLTIEVTFQYDYAILNY